MAESDGFRRAGSALRVRLSPRPGVMTVPFRFFFTGPSPAAVERACAVSMEPLEDLEDYWYLAVQACGVLAQTDACFHLGGFG
jgi:hypothetical protein